MRHTSTISLAISILFLYACSHTALNNNDLRDSIQLAADSVALTTLTHWQLRGKLGVRSSNSASTANLQWLQQQQAFSLKLSGPLGTGTLTAEGDYRTIEVKQGDKTFRGKPSTIGQQLLGLPLPVDAFGWWAKGLPSPTLSPPTKLLMDFQGNPTYFEQAGWQLSFSKFQMTQGYYLPRKLSGQMGDLSFKLMISAWQIQDE
jgi:outer membrane lipoprotein LolB